MNLTSRQDKLSLQEVEYMFQTQEMRIEQLNSVSKIEVNSAQANVANFRRGTNYRGNGGHQNMYNHGRGQSGSKGRGRIGFGRGNGNGGRGNRPVCQLYGRAGHVALKCYYRFNISFNG